MSKAASPQTLLPRRLFYRYASIPVTVTLTFFMVTALQDFQKKHPHRPPTIPSRAPDYGPPLKFNPTTALSGQGPEASLANSELEEKLKKRLELSFEETPLQEALDVLAKECGINFQVHKSANDIISGDGLEVTALAKDLTAKNSLNLILSANPDLIYQLREDHILIGTHYNLKRAETLQFYDISEHVKRAHPYQEMRWRYELETGEAFAPIVDTGVSHCGAILEDGKTDYTRAFFYRLFEAMLHSFDYDEDDGLDIWGGVIGIRGDEDVHKRIQLTLKGLSENARTKEDLVIEEFPTGSNNKPKSAENQAIEKQLNETIVTTTLRSMTLQHAVLELTKLAGLQFSGNSEIDTDMVITLEQFDKVPLREALRRILAKDNLLAIPYCGALRVISQEQLANFSQRIFKIVNIRDLLYPNDKVNPLLNHRYNLIEYLSELTNEKIYEDGSFIYVYGEHMLLYQRQEVLEQVDKLLGELKQGLHLPRPKVKSD